MSEVIIIDNTACWLIPVLSLVLIIGFMMWKEYKREQREEKDKKEKK